MAEKTTAINDEIAQRRRAVILEAAEALLAIHGFDGLRLRDVAQHAGVSIGMIQHYFVTRDELLRETIRAANEHRVNEWGSASARGGSATVRLTALLDGALADRHRCTVWVETCAAATRHPELRDEVQQTQASWRSTLLEVMQAGTASGEFLPRGKTEDIVATIIALIDGLMLETAITGDRQSAAVESRQRQLRELGHRLLGILE